MTDKELLELAAKAAGIDGQYVDDETHDYDIVGPYNGDGIYRPWVGCGFGVIWNPLEEDGDALRLAVQMGIDILITRSGETTTFGKFTDEISVASKRYVEPHNDDPYAATRRAIVMAAAEIGREE